MAASPSPGKPAPCACSRQPQQTACRAVPALQAPAPQSSLRCMRDPKDLPRDIAGGLIAPSLDGGRMAAQLRLGHRTLEVETRDGQRFSLPLDELEVEQGGASGRMVMLHQNSSRITAFSEDGRLLTMLGSQGTPKIQARVRQLIAATRQRRRRRRTWLLGSLTVLVLLIVGLKLSAGALGSWLLGAVPHEVDEKLGEVGWTQMRGGLRIVHKDKTEKALDVMLRRLKKGGLSQRWQYELVLVEDKRVNAFALPGGRMVFFTGLIEKAKRPEEVAAVMAHELAHVTERHGTRRVVQSVGIIGALQVLLGDVGGIIGLAKELLALSAINSYSRDQEAEADTEAVELLRQAHLDPMALATFFRRLEKEGGDVPDYLEWMSTHPSHEARVRAVRRQLKGREVTPRPLSMDWKAVQAELR